MVDLTAARDPLRRTSRCVEVSWSWWIPCRRQKIVAVFFFWLGELFIDVCIFGEMMYKFQWIGLRENLQETSIFNGKNHGFLQIFPQSNDWKIKWCLYIWGNDVCIFGYLWYLMFGLLKYCWGNDVIWKNYVCILLGKWCLYIWRFP